MPRRFFYISLGILALAAGMFALTVANAEAEFLAAGVYGAGNVWAFTTDGDAYLYSASEPWQFKGNIFGGGGRVLRVVILVDTGLWAFATNGDVFRGGTGLPFDWVPWNNVFGGLGTSELVDAMRGGSQTLWAFAANGDVYTSTPEAGQTWELRSNVLSSPPNPTTPTTWGQIKSAVGQ